MGAMLTVQAHKCWESQGLRHGQTTDHVQRARQISMKAQFQCRKR
jgi:hypothetical protein